MRLIARAVDEPVNSISAHRIAIPIRTLQCSIATLSRRLTLMDNTNVMNNAGASYPDLAGS